MEFLQLILFEGILGYGLQAIAFIIGMHGIARHKIDMKKSLIVCAISAVITYLIRTSGLFTFGVHTMLVLLIINAACITINKISIRPCILASILMMIMVLLSELFNVGILYLIVGTTEQVNATLANEVYKAASAIPGNVLLLLASIVIYKFRLRGGEKNGSGEQAG